MNDPRGVLEEFVRACDGFRGSREARYESCDALLDPESQRSKYRDNHEARGICRSCKTNAKPGRKYCQRHLDLANERARRSLASRVAKP